MNFVDILIILLLVASGIRGTDIGFVRQFGSLAGLCLGVALGGWFASVLNVHGNVAILLIVGFVMLGVVLGELLGLKLKVVFHDNKVNIIDKACGALMGVITCLLAVWISSMLVPALNSKTLQRSVRDSATIGVIDKTLPPATDIIAKLESFFVDAGLPDFIKTTEPKLPKNDIQLPKIESFAEVITSSKTSIAEVEGRSCSGFEMGSGFVADKNLVVTNAHVVAGMRYPFVRLEGKRYLAKVVAFDPDLDIAVLSSSSINTASLLLNEDLAKNGTLSVALGFPGGGSFRAKPSIVSDKIRVVSKDIYGQNQTERQVYVLRSDIEEGNSGGPLLDKTGKVIGVIFARSSTYAGVGYALTMPDVINVIKSAKENPSAGQNLRCL